MKKIIASVLVILITFNQTCLHGMEMLFSNEYGLGAFYQTTSPELPSTFDTKAHDTSEQFCNKLKQMHLWPLIPDKNRCCDLKQFIGLVAHYQTIPDTVFEFQSEYAAAIRGELLNELKLFQRRMEPILSQNGIICGDKSIEEQSGKKPFFGRQFKSTPFEIIQNCGKDSDFWVIGDIHGAIDKLEHVLEEIQMPVQKNGKEERSVLDSTYHVKPGTSLVFTGDYVDRGSYSYEVLITLLKLEKLNPGQVFLCRGNHESTAINFKDTFESIYGDPELFHAIKNFYTYLAHAVYIGCESDTPNQPYYAVGSHGGIPRSSNQTDAYHVLPMPPVQSQRIYRPICSTPVSPEDICNVNGFLWNDYHEHYFEPTQPNPARGNISCKLAHTSVEELYKPTFSHAPVILNIHGHKHSTKNFTRTAPNIFLTTVCGAYEGQSIPSFVHVNLAKHVLHAYEKSPNSSTFRRQTHFLDYPYDPMAISPTQKAFLDYYHQDYSEKNKLALDQLNQKDPLTVNMLLHENEQKQSVSAPTTTTITIKK